MTAFRKDAVEHGQWVYLPPTNLLEWPVDARGPGAPWPFNLTLVILQNVFGVSYCGLTARIALTYTPGEPQLPRYVCTKVAIHQFGCFA